MYAIQLNRDEILIVEVLIEQVLYALPKSFKYQYSPSSLSKGKIVAVNGHSTVSLQIIADDLWLFVTPKNASGLADYDSRRSYFRLALFFSGILLEIAQPA